MKYYQEVTDIVKRFSFLFVGVAILILLEAAQQYYYVVNFSLTDEEGAQVILGLMNQHLLWWAIWSVTAIGFVFLISNSRFELSKKQFLVWSGWVILFFISTTLIYSAIQYIRLDGEAGFYEIVQFKVFQKLPISLLAYILCVVFSFTFKQKEDKIALSEDLKKLELQLKTKGKAKSISAKIGSARKVIQLDNINYIEADDYCVNVHTFDNRKFVVRTSLKKLENELPEMFIRVHRKYLVNSQGIKEVRRDESNELVMENGVSIKVAKNRNRVLAEFLQLTS